MDFTGRAMKSQFKVADRQKAAYCLIVGEQELAAFDRHAEKSRSTGEQKSLPRESLVTTLGEQSRRRTKYETILFTPLRQW